MSIFIVWQSKWERERKVVGQCLNKQLSLELSQQQDLKWIKIECPTPWTFAKAQQQSKPNQLKWNGVNNWVGISHEIFIACTLINWRYCVLRKMKREQNRELKINWISWKTFIEAKGRWRYHKLISHFSLALDWVFIIIDKPFNTCC